jgi:D-hydroxyproline dehydrogenase subunit alpha
MITANADVLVVGGGPAGLAAAIAAAPNASVTVLDDNPSVGGQIWRSGVNQETARRNTARYRIFAAFAASRATLCSARRVISAPQPGLLHALNENSGTVEAFSYRKLVLATGARERFLPFPGWTLPGVFGAGGLQALVKGGFGVAGKRIVVAGTGPLLLAIAAHLQQDGAKIVTIAEQATRGRLVSFALRLLRRPAKLVQGAALRAQLRGVSYRTGCWPLAADGTTNISAVQLTNGRRVWTERCELLACGFHLVPNTELAVLLGCKLQDEYVQVDTYQQTSVPDIYCAGEPTGVAGVDAALIQGRIAGLAATGGLHQAKALLHRSRAEQAFGKALSAAFALRPELRYLPQPDTIVCRCEDVRFRELEGFDSWTDAKLQTRCGMGPCQGRICGPAVQALFGWRNSSVRPPLFPVPLAALCADLGPVAEHTPPHPTEVQETI